MIYLYIDDILVTRSKKSEIRRFKELMMYEFEMTKLDILSYFLEMEFLKTSRWLMLHPIKYDGEIIKRFKPNDCISITKPIESNIKLEKEGNEEKVDSTEVSLQ